MNDLGPESRALLQSTRDADALGAEVRARIRRGVLMQVATLGGTAAASGSAAAMALTTKLGLLGLGIAVLGGASLSLWVWKHPATPQIVIQHSSTPSKPQEVEPTSLRPASEPASRPSNQRPEARPKRILPGSNRAVPAWAEPHVPVSSNDTLDSLNPELAVLRQAQNDLRTGHPDLALQRLEAFEARLGPGALGQEREALAAIALCRAQPGPAARARAEKFVRTAPESPLTARVQAACEGASGASR